MVSLSLLHPEALKANRPCERFFAALSWHRFVMTFVLLAFVLFVVLAALVH